MKQLHSLLLIAIVTIFVGCDKTTVEGTRGKSDICEIHHVQMVKKKVPIAYGLFSATPFSLAYHAASTNSFPHAEDVVGGGCVVDTTKWAIIYSCPECERIRHQWELEYVKKTKGN